MVKSVRLLQKYATGRVVLVLFTLTMVVYLTMLFYSIPAVVSFAPDMTLFDLSPSGYTFDYAVALLEALGPKGRTTYLTLQLPLDFFYPGLFAITYSLLLIWLFRKGTKAGSKILYFALVPIFAGLFDYIENVYIVIMLKSFPDIPSRIVESASLFTILKSSFTTIFFVLFFWALIRFVKEKRSVVRAEG
ncbi:MAG: hypothetical protein KZQ99_12425 [Candidatus Thiodiazotropha sp. (ex Dulcina madagascariensis)]|nr:hypothetical protein [Candidatus Thiodiazotropha sp. (ex Dulcina madagascariensis)]